MEESGFEFKNVAHQYFATMAANLIMLGHGAVVSWFSPSLPILLSEETPLISGPLNNEQLSWLGSINNLGALGGVLTFGFITTFLGCKRAMSFLALPSIAFWLLIFFGNTYYHLLFARFFAGWTGGGIQTTIILFVSEISNDHIRGRLGSLTTLSRNIGVLLIFTIGAYADYFLVPCIFIFLPIAFLVVFFILPNTPQFYLRKGMFEEADYALKYYKGYEGKSEVERNAFNKEFDRLQSLAKERKEDKKVNLSDFFELKAVKGLLFGIILGWLTQFPGSITLLNYAVIIFEKSGASKIDPYISSIILAAAQLIGCLFSAKLADSMGRKLVLIISFMGSAMGLLVFALYLYLNQIGHDLSAYSWLPVASLSFIMFISSAGVYALYAVCVVEYLPSKIRTIGLTICVLSLYTSTFTFVKVFPFVLELIDLWGCMIIFMVGSVVGALFVTFALEETNGKSLDTLKSSETKCYSFHNWIVLYRVMEETEYQWRNGHQYIAAITANLIMLAHGCIVGWFSPALPKLLSDNTPLITGPFTSEEVSWVGSIMNIGALCGTFTFGFINTFLGCKRAMIFLAMPSTIFWILIYFGDSYNHILIARFFTGWTGGGIQTTIVLYIAEISNDNIRGRLGSIIQLSRNTGILIAYIVGAIVDYKYIPCIFIFLPLLYVLCFVFLPNTPQYYLRNDRVQKAQEALKYYKGYKGKTDAEINMFNIEFERMKSIAKEQQADEKLRVNDFTNRKALKGIMIGIALSYFSQLTGCFTIITYAVYILERTGMKLDAYFSSIALAVMLIVGNLCTTNLADKFGRKTFSIVSLLGTALGLIALSAFLYLNKNGYDLSDYAWVPVFCLAFVIFIASAGIIPLSHVIRVENLPTKIRTVGLAICIFALNITSFTCTKLFPLLLDKVDVYGCMLIFAINCIVGSFFIYFVLDETRGKPMDTLKAEQNQTENTNC
ncbi:uncharacterized protein LOC129567002 [Sitodiplosis mosellana]|uniref:uncharacterized protein LOC129567002 n=1 Tax=Sitodiplosis mosellana TaxID=263140 RepID=UPI0024450654|nr:uncharacterized protein LOC129567002 [Sitodiplosis mosellana]